MVNKVLKLSRKYLRKVTSVFLAFYLIFSPLFSFPFDVFAADELVSPSSLNGWVPTVNDGAVIDFVSALDSAKPGGALHLTTPNNNDSRSRLTKSVDVLLSDISEISFDSKKVGGPSYANAAFRLGLDNEGNGSLDQWIVYEPYYNGTVSGDWQTWDVLNGKFWGSWNSGGGYTTNEVLNDVPGVGASTRVLAISIGLGNTNPLFDVLVDNVIFDTTVYDFQEDPVDTDGPVVEIVAPDISKGNPTITGNATDPSGIKSHWFEIRHPSGNLFYWSNMNTPLETVNFPLGDAKDTGNNPITIVDGEYRIRYVSTDTLGNRSDAPSYSNPEIHYLLIDNTAPQISNIQITPQINGNIGGVVTVTFDVIEDGSGLDIPYGRVLFADGPNTPNQLKESAKAPFEHVAGNSYRAIIDTTQFVKVNYVGSYNLTFNFRDLALNNRSSKPIEFRPVLIDNSGPGSSLLSPTSGSYVFGLTTLEFGFTDHTGLSAVRMRLRGPVAGGEKWYTVTNFTDTDGSITIDTSELPDGEYIVDLRPVDSFGRPRLGANKGTIIVDNTKPQIEILTPTVENEVLLGTTTKVRATDNIKLKQVTGHVYNSANTLVKSCSQNVSGLDVTEFELTCDVSSLGTGVYYVKANTRDMTDAISTTITRNFIIDKEHPVINEARMYVNGVESWLTKPGDTVRIEADVTDVYSPVDSVTIWVREWPWNPNNNQLAAGQMNHVSGDTWEYSFVVPGTYQDGDSLNEVFEGNYFNFRPYDAVGNSHIGWRHNFTIDATSPVIGPVTVVLDYLSKYVHGDGFILGASVSDLHSGVDTDTCEITYDGINWLPGTYTLGYCGVLAPSFEDAANLSLNVRVKDVAGNTGEGSEILREVDDLLPTTTVDIAEDFYGPVTLSSLVFNGTASDTVSGISDVKTNLRRSSNNQYWTGIGNLWLATDFLKQDTTFTPTDVAGSTNWSYSGGFPTFVNGLTYTVYSYARDNVHLLQWGGGTTDSFIWDSQAPVNPIVSYPDYTNNENVSVTWSGSSDALSGVDGHYYSFSSSPETPAQNPLYWLEESELSATETLGEGEWYFNIITVDNVGNVSNVSSFGPIVVDLTDPVVDILSHTEGELVSGVQTVDVEVVDDNLLRYYFVILNSSNSVIAGPGTVNHDGPSVSPSLLWNTELVPDGEYRIRIEARDKANNKGAVSVKTVKVIVDNTAGVSTMTSPVDSTVTSAPVSIIGQSEDLNGIDTVELFYKEAGSIDPWTSIAVLDNVADDSPYAWSYDWTPSLDGIYDIKASSTDVLGNVENSAYALNVKYDTTAPVITLLGNDPVTLTEGDTYTDAGAQATDNLDGDLTSSIVANNPVNTNVPGVYVIAYNVSDEAGNTAAQVTRTVTVNEAPEEPQGEVLGEQDNNAQGNNISLQTLGENENDGTEEEGEVLGLICEVEQTMTGYIYLDENGNGRRDSGEEGIEGVRVRIVYTDEDGEEVVVDTVRTDSNGMWKVEVCPGEYEVRLDESTLPSDVKLDGEAVLSVTVNDGEGENDINFSLVSAESDESGFDYRWLIVIVVVAGIALLLWRRAASQKPVATMM